MAWFDFTCRLGGDNRNAGSLDGVGETATTPVLTTTNGAWDNTTGVFTCAGAPDLSGLAVGQRVSFTLDATTSPTTNEYLTGSITAYDNTAKTITVGNRVAIGTFATAASGVTARVGGAWSGPGGSSSFPFNMNLTTPSANPLRINLKNDKTYIPTVALSTSGGPAGMRIQGYSSTFGDGGKFVMDGGTSGASFTLFTVATASQELYDAEFRNNGATGTAAGLSVTGALCDLFRVTVHDVRGNGINQSSGRSVLTECLTYACNQSNGGSLGGIVQGTSSIPCMYVRVVSRDNVGSNNIGVFLNSSSMFVARDCVIESNGNIGLSWPGTSSMVVATGCDFYANGSDGFRFNASSGTKPVFLTDCNFVANGGYGVNGTGAGTAMGILQNCGFGSGTAGNTSGATNSLGDTRVDGSVTYDSGQTPWNDPANGDFTVTLAAAKGRGTGLNFSPTVSYPDRAAAQGAAA